MPDDYQKYKREYIPKQQIIFNNIASFYGSEKLYSSGYPLTLQNFLKTLSKKNSDKIVNNSIYKLKKIAIAINKSIFNGINYNGNRCCEVFGVDFFSSETYNCHILECNIGPGMDPHNEEDNKIRNYLFKNIIMLL